MTGTGELACFDFDGKEVWKINAQDRYGRFEYGFGKAAQYAAAARRPTLPAAHPLDPGLGDRAGQGDRQRNLEGGAPQ
jgi:hypothetical protein